MARAAASVVVERPPEEVFAFLSDPDTLPEWQASALEARQESPGAMTTGTRIKEVRKFLGRRMETVVEVTAYEPGRQFSLKVASGPIPFQVRQNLHPVEGGTKIDVVIEGEPGGFFKLAEPLVVRAVGRELENNLATLKDVLESRPERPDFATR
jgi:carbon monoxide dehydrogenase subunit G